VTSLPLTSEDLAVISLGAAAPRMDAEQAVAALGHLPAGRTAIALRRNKAILIADERLRELADAGGPHASMASDIRADLAEFVEGNVSRHGKLEGRIAQLGEIARQMSIGIGAMKGLSSARLYPEELRRRRDLGDIDVYVDTADAAWELTRVLAEDGYRYDPDEPPWIKRAPDGRIYGQMRLLPPVGSSAPGGAREQEAPDDDMARRLRGPGNDLVIDIHYDRYSVRHCSWLEVPVELPVGELTYVDPITNFAYVIADAAGDYFTSTKVLNDFYFLLERTDASVGDLVERLRRAKLERFFATVVRRMSTALDLPARHRAALAGVSAAKAEPMPPVDDFDLRTRARVTTLHAFRVGQDRSLAEAARNGASAFVSYRKSARVRLSKRSRPVRVNEASPSRCTRLLPVHSVREALGAEAPPPAAGGGANGHWHPIPGATRMQALTTGSGDLVRVGSDVFIPTVWGGLPERLVAIAETVAS
jgi:hypothetical protein